MNIQIILPNGTWYYDDKKLLGKGGLGDVFSGTSQEYGDIAVKKITFDTQEKAHRELRIADDLAGKNYQHIIPIFDSGEDKKTGNNYLVMARADKSLKKYIEDNGFISDNNTIDILLQIVTGLMEVPHLIHRDLKPANILFHQNSWKIADFGIAKYIEESTSLNTLKEYLTAEYAAPEQWNLETPTNSVDIYALGCISYSLLTGYPPYKGTREELKRQHLTSTPPILNCNEKLKIIITMMLGKTSNSRPSLTSIKSVLEQINDKETTVKGFNTLTQAASKISEASLKDDARKFEILQIRNKRENDAINALKNLSMIIEVLISKIAASAPNIKTKKTPQGNWNNNEFFYWLISLGNAELHIDINRFRMIDESVFKRSKWDVITGSIIKVVQNTNDYYEWSANLWFTNRGNSDEYRWWEVMYMDTISRHSHKYEPFAVENPDMADRAAGPASDIIQFGSKLKPIDHDSMENFYGRWVSIFAQAVENKLCHPRYLPIG